MGFENFDGEGVVVVERGYWCMFRLLKLVWVLICRFGLMGLSMLGCWGIGLKMCGFCVCGWFFGWVMWKFGGFCKSCMVWKLMGFGILWLCCFLWFGLCIIMVWCWVVIFYWVFWNMFICGWVKFGWEEGLVWGDMGVDMESVWSWLNIGGGGGGGVVWWCMNDFRLINLVNWLFKVLGLLLRWWVM